MATNIRQWARQWNDRDPQSSNDFHQYLIGNATFADCAIEALERMTEEVEEAESNLAAADADPDIPAAVKTARTRLAGGEDPEAILREMLEQIDE